MHGAEISQGWLHQMRAGPEPRHPPRAGNVEKLVPLREQIVKELVVWSTKARPGPAMRGNSKLVATRRQQKRRVASARVLATLT